MATIYHQVGIRAPIETVYEAIATTKGISAWWTPTTGETSTGGKLVFHFGDHKVNMEVLKSVDNQLVVWKNIDDDGQWKDTLFSFELQADGDQVMVNFSHAGWIDVTELFTHCSTKWAVFLVSLKDYLETGKGRPFPDDIQINHMEN